ncbi:MAG: aconitase X swivel domain-containing protein [Bacillota bacterium]|jgi:predicted aconitase with swiveling domain
MHKVIHGKSIVSGRASGKVVISQEPFSFFGGFDFSQGTIVDPRSDIYGESLKDKIFAYPRGKGSSSTAGVILEALRQGVAPKAIINVESEKILAVGIIVAEVTFGWSLPVVSISEEDYQLLAPGDLVEIIDDRVIITKIN